MDLLYEGKAKKVYKTDDINNILIRYKDSATAFNGEKKETIDGKGKLNMAFAKYFFSILENEGIKTHTIDYLDELSMIARKVDIIPLEVVVRNYAAGSVCKREGFKKGHKFETPLFEIFYKNDALGDPLITEDEAVARKIATKEEIEKIKNETLKINKILSDYVRKKGVTLVDFKIEFGKTSMGEIILADEISPDTCRFWKIGTTESLDKDVFRENKGSLIDSYTNLANILGVKL